MSDGTRAEATGVDKLLAVDGVPAGALVLLAGAWLLSLVTQGFIIIPASIVDQITAATGVDDSTAVWLVSATPGAWAASNFLVGTVIDRWGDVRVTAAGTALFVATALWCFVAARQGDFYSLLAARVVAGVAIGAIWTAGANLVGRAFPLSTSGTAIGIFTASAPAGFAITQISTPPLSAAAGWPAPFALYAALAVVALGGFFLGVRATSPDPPDHDTTVGADFSTVLRNRAVVLGSLMAFAAYSLYLFLNSWLPSYLSATFPISASTSGLIAALFPVMGVLSRSGGGVLSDRLFGGNRLGVLRLSFLTASPVVAVMVLTDRLAVLVVLLVVAGFTIQLSFGVVYAYVREAVTEDIAGTALSVLGTAGITGAFTAPLIAGELIGWTGSYTTAFGYAVVLGVVGLALTAIAPDS
jgi:nitrate/nitrite transporter NarK